MCCRHDRHRRPYSVFIPQHHRADLFVCLFLWHRNSHDGAESLPLTPYGEARTSRCAQSGSDAEAARPTAGVILVGNNLVNFSCRHVATIIGYNLLGDTGVLLAPWVLTITFLIFAEVAPKTLAAERPEAWALKAVFALEPLAKVLHPAVLLINSFSNALVKPFLPNASESDDQLTKDELITVVNEGAHAVGERKNHDDRLLDLETVTVNDIMVPRTEIVSINIDDDMADILTSAAASQHTLLPVYKDNFNNMLGVLHLRRLARLVTSRRLYQGRFTAIGPRPLLCA